MTDTPDIIRFFGQITDLISRFTGKYLGCKAIITSLKSIILIEDDLYVREALCELLRTEGYEVFEAGNGSVGLQVLLNVRTPGIVLLDLIMPVMTGWEFLVAKAADPRISEIPVLVMSTLIDRHGCEGATETMKKPINFDILLERIRHYCGITGA